jgi:hypothetical protein
MLILSIVFALQGERHFPLHSRRSSPVLSSLSISRNRFPVGTIAPGIVQLIESCLTSPMHLSNPQASSFEINFPSQVGCVTSASLNFFSFFSSLARIGDDVGLGRAKAIFLSAPFRCHKLNNWKIKQPLKQIDCMYTHKQRRRRRKKEPCEHGERNHVESLSFCLFTPLSHLPALLQSIELKRQPPSRRSLETRKLFKSKHRSNSPHAPRPGRICSPEQ